MGIAIDERIVLVSAESARASALRTHVDCGGGANIRGHDDPARAPLRPVDAPRVELV